MFQFCNYPGVSVDLFLYFLYGSLKCPVHLAKFHAPLANNKHGSELMTWLETICLLSSPTIESPERLKNESLR